MKATQTLFHLFLITFRAYTVKALTQCDINEMTFEELMNVDTTEELINACDAMGIEGRECSDCYNCVTEGMCCPDEQYCWDDATFSYSCSGPGECCEGEKKCPDYSGEYGNFPGECTPYRDDPAPNCGCANYYFCEADNACVLFDECCPSQKECPGWGCYESYQECP